MHHCVFASRVHISHSKKRKYTKKIICEVEGIQFRIGPHLFHDSGCVDGDGAATAILLKTMIVFVSIQGARHIDCSHSERLATS